jgi:hypothetical protein
VGRLAGLGREHLAALVVLFCAVVLTIFNVRTFDLFWHMANGREMAQSGEVVLRELFSHTHYNEPFENHEWLSQLLLYLTYSSGGLIGLQLLKATLVAVTVGLLYSTVRIFGPAPLPASLLCLLAVGVGLERFMVRPGLFSFALLVLLQWVMYGFRAGRRGPFWLALVPVVMVVWDLLQGAVYGLIFLGAFGAGELAKWALKGKLTGWSGCVPMSTARIRACLICAVATLLCMGLNPHGLTTYGSILGVLSDPTFGQGILEWLPPDFSWTHLDFWLFLALACLLLLSGGRKVDPTALMVLLPFAVMALRYRRAVAVFTLVATPLVAQALAPLLCRTGAGVSRAVRRPLVAALVALVVAIGTAGYKLGGGAQAYTFGWQLEEGLFPVGSVRFIREVGLSGRMFNSDRFGGYLAYHLTPERPIFHYNLPAIFGDFETRLRTPGALKGESFDYAIVWREEELRIVSPPDWVPVYREPGAIVLARRGSVNQAVIERYGITRFDPNLDGATAERLAGKGPAAGATLVGELVDHLSFRHNPRMASLLGWLLSLGAGEIPPARQLELLSRCSKWNGREPALLFATGSARYQLGERAAAREALRRALAADPSAPWARAARLTLAYLILDEGQPDAAVQRFEKLAGEQPDDQEVLYGLALAWEQAGDPHSAIEAWRGYLRVAPPGPWREKAQARLDRLVASPSQ